MKCIHCNGTYGAIIGGTHNLCAAKAKLGIKIAKVTTCDSCGGNGFDNAKMAIKGKAISGMISPSGSVFDAITRTCVCLKCGGKGKL